MNDKDGSSAFCKQNIQPNPMESAGLLSKIFFWWSLPIFFKKKNLLEEDLYSLPESQQSQILATKFEDAWIAEQNLHKNPSLWRAFFKAFGRDIALLVPALLVQEIGLRFAEPFLLSSFLSYFIPNQNYVSKNEAILYSSLLLINRLGYILIKNHWIFNHVRFEIKVYTAICNLIYRKALRLSRSGCAETTVGHVVNLITNDADRFRSTFFTLHYLWLGPLKVVVIIYAMNATLGVHSLAGIAILAVFIPLQMYLGKKIASFKISSSFKCDERVRLMNEIISGIQTIKMYAWEKPFAQLVEKSRKSELQQIERAGFMNAFTYPVWFDMKRIALFFCVSAFVLNGHKLDPRYLYMITLFYGQLVSGIMCFLKQTVSMISEVTVSVNRISRFLDLGDLSPIDAVGKSLDNQTNAGIFMKNASVKWLQTSDQILKSINFTAASNQLVAVIGRVGSGKTSLLNVILGELPIIKGDFEMEGTISYASQEPWLFSGSIKQNILFGSEMNLERYREVIKVCSLEHDLCNFPGGDSTLVGERGVMLSGGQKSRINLARAVYREADIYLLDDPLSAVDVHVGKEIFTKCFLGFLRKKCTILVTHQLQYLKKVDRMFLVENGEVTSSGNYEEFQKSKPDFISLLQETPQPKDFRVIDDATERKFLSSKLTGREKEEEIIGAVSKSVYQSYLQAGGTWRFLGVIVLFAASQLVGTSTDYFLSFWISLEESHSKEKNATYWSDWTKISFNSRNLISIYILMLVSIITLSIASIAGLVVFTMTASRNLHNNMFSNIICSKLRFFHKNASGTILNRFSKDIRTIDESLPKVISDTLEIAIVTISSVSLICFVSLWMTVPTIVFVAVFSWYKNLYLTTITEVKRLHATGQNRVISHLIASIQGLTTIRAFSAQNSVMERFDGHQNRQNSAYFTLISCNRALTFWSDFCCFIYMMLVTMSFFFVEEEVIGGNVGLAITQSLSFIGVLQWGIRQWSELETQMTSVERVVEYTKVPREPDTGTDNLRKDWPTDGKIQFQNVSMRYSPQDPLVLKNLNFVVKSREKIGIVGRSGAGKSSLVSTLFRLVDFAGDVFIDGINTKTISLCDLRSKIAIIPQDPVLFSGNLRKNLDPFDEYEDTVIWKALREVELKQYVSEDLLKVVVSEGGTNFSIGQRQLLCLARAIIRGSQILILDEATASVDTQTDELIQNTIRQKFKDCSVLTIAHRLNTIMDSDRILVMEDGHLAEFDSPQVLLQDVDGKFFNLVQEVASKH